MKKVKDLGYRKDQKMIFEFGDFFFFLLFLFCGGGRGSQFHNYTFVCLFMHFVCFSLSLWNYS